MGYLGATVGFDVIGKISYFHNITHKFIIIDCLYVLALFLKHHLYVKHTFSLKSLNNFLTKRSSFRQERRDVVERIESKHIKKDEHIKQKASCMLVIAYNIPIFLGEHLDDSDQWYSNLLSLIRITVICFKPVVDETTAGVLQSEITQFLHSFCEIYSSERVKPKMHFLLHFPRQLQDFGPLRHHGTMRSEGKHQEFKNHRWMNFNNLPLSLLKRHQLCLGNILCDSRGQLKRDFLQEGHQGVSPCAGRGIRVEELGCLLRDALEKHIAAEEMIEEHNSMVWHGRWYDNNCCLLLSESEEDGPVFGLIEKLYVSQADITRCFAWVRVAENPVYKTKFNAFQVQVSTVCRCVELATLLINWPVPKHTVGEDLLIFHRYGIVT